MIINGDSFLTFLHSLSKPLIYLSLGLCAFVENIFPPIPGDTITAFGAFLAAMGELDFLGVYISTTLGNLIGFMALFWLGSYLGRRFFIKQDFWLFKAKDIIKAERWFIKYGYFIIMINRFLPGARSVISIAGGISRLKTNKVLVLCLISCAAWNLIWVFMGYSLGNNWAMVKTEITSHLARYNITVVSIFGLLLLLFILFKWIKRND